MSKRVALHDFIEIDNVDLSQYCRSVRFNSEHQQIDVSGFTASGADEFLAGNTVQSVELEMFGSYGSTEVHQVLYPLHRDRSVFDFVWRPNMNSAVSATNPELRGSVQALTYGPGASRGEADTFTVTLTAADADGLEFFAT
jgi:hypothetical protein